MSQQALWILTALGTAVFSTAAARRIHSTATLAAAFVAGVVLFHPDTLPSAGWAGGLVTATAIAYLLRPGWVDLPAASAGLLAGILETQIEFQTVPMGVAIPLAILIPGVSVWLARRMPEFAPEAIRDEALLLVLAIGLGASIVPAVVEGWRSAGALNGPAGGMNSAAIPAWVLAISAVSGVLGACYSLWRAR